MRRNKKISIKSLIWVPLIAGIVFLILVSVLKLNGVFEKKEPEIITNSTLMRTVDVSELSTAEFIYNGIAEIYEGDDADTDTVKCRVRYKARVKAAINMDEITFDIDDEKKTVRPSLPKISLKASLDNQEGLSFIPENSKIDLQEAMEACEKDVTAEAKENEELYQSAEENLQDVIEALTYPILNAKGYSLVWE